MLGESLGGLIAQVLNGKIVLPAMQRPFVWNEERITRLIDSLLKVLHLGSAMIWRSTKLQRFRHFQTNVSSDGSITRDFEINEHNEELYLVLDGQQRLTGLLVATSGTYDNKQLFLDVLSGKKDNKDPGEMYWNCQFLSRIQAEELNKWHKESTNNKDSKKRELFISFTTLTRYDPNEVYARTKELAQKYLLNDEQREYIGSTLLRCSTTLTKSNVLHIHRLDTDISNKETPLEEILEIFVRVNSGGLVLQKSDLLMSLLDLKWNNIQPEIFRAVDEINKGKPFLVTRDDILKSLLLAHGDETRFTRLVARQGEG